MANLITHNDSIFALKTVRLSGLYYLSSPALLTSDVYIFVSVGPKSITVVAMHVVPM